MATDLKAIMTVDGDMPTRVAGVLDNITRAALAADLATKAGFTGAFVSLAKGAIRVQEAPYNVIADGVYRAGATTQLQAALDLADSSLRAVDLGAGTIITDTLNYRMQHLMGPGPEQCILQGRPGQDVLHADLTLGSFTRDGRVTLDGLTIVVDDSVDASSSFPTRSGVGNAGLAFDHADGSTSSLRMTRCDMPCVIFRSLSITPGGQNESCGFYAQNLPNLTRFGNIQFYRLAYGWWEDYPTSNLASGEHAGDHNTIEALYINGCGRGMRKVNSEADAWASAIFHAVGGTHALQFLGVQSAIRSACSNISISNLYIEDYATTPIDFGNALDFSVDHGGIAGPHGAVTFSCSDSRINLYVAPAGGAPIVIVSGHRNKVRLALGVSAAGYGARDVVSDTGYGNSVSVTRWTDGSGVRTFSEESLSYDGRGVVHQRDALSMLMGHTDPLFVSGDDLLVRPRSIVPVGSTEGTGHSWLADTSADLGEKLRILGTAGGFYSITDFFNGHGAFVVGGFLPPTKIRVYAKAKLATGGTQGWQLLADTVDKGSATLTWTTAYTVQSFDIDLTGIATSAVLQLNVGNAAGGGVAPLDVAWIGFRPFFADMLVAGVGSFAALAVGNSAAATTPGTVTDKMEVFDASGASLGYVAIYDAIT